MIKNAKRDSITALFSQFAGQDGTLVIPRAYIMFCQGDHLAALLLSQILYWSDRTDDPDGWFAKSYEDWQKELCMTDYQIKRAISGDKRRKNGGFCLVAVGIETKLRQSKFYGGAATLHYRVNQEVLQTSISAYLDPDNVGNETKADPDNVENRIPTLLETGSPSRSEQSQKRSTEITTETISETIKAVAVDSVDPSAPDQTAATAAADIQTVDPTPEKTAQQELAELISTAQKLATQPPAPSETALSPDLARVCTYFENHIQPLSGLIVERIKDAVATYPVDWLIEAIDQAVLYNKRNWAYIEAILKRKESGASNGHPTRDSRARRAPEDAGGSRSGNENSPSSRYRWPNRDKPSPLHPRDEQERERETAQHAEVPDV